MKNADLPAHPTLLYNRTSGETNGHELGLTKREIFCLHNSIPKTGDEELDAIIREGNKRKAAMAAMQGFLSNSFYAQHVDGDLQMDRSLAKRSIEVADELLKHLSYGATGIRLPTERRLYKRARRIDKRDSRNEWKA